jgi:hypothetical protein
MSIATLKKKTQTQYNNMSVNSKQGFSLNGTHRSQGFVGQTSLSRSLPRTLMNGNTARGHGGCCGKYIQTPIVQSSVQSQENPNVIKSSVLGTSGMIDTKYRWINRPAPFSTVKPDNTMNSNSQGDYVISRAKQAIQIADASNNIVKKIGSVSKCQNYNSYFKKAVCNYTKPTSDYVPISQGELMLRINNRCVNNDVKFIPQKVQRTPFPGFN